jgi:RHS repeat-associated protein
MVSKQISWPLSDHQGTVRNWVNNSGVIQNHIRYDSFGKIVSQIASALNPRFSYTGSEWNGEIGLYFYRARYYDATMGRFSGEDPIEFGAQDANLYRYVFNSSMNRIDPMGLQVAAPVAPPVAPPVTLPPVPPPGPWFLPLLRTVAPLVIPGGILNPQRTNPYEFPRDLPQAPNCSPRSKKDRWQCQASCNVQQIDRRVNCPPRVTGSALGSSEPDACAEAKRAATQATPQGCYPRHCQCKCRKV